MTPLERFRPGGTAEPVAAAQLQAYGTKPPEAVRENPLPLLPYAAWTVPLGGMAEVIARGGGGLLLLPPPPQALRRHKPQTRIESNDHLLMMPPHDHMRSRWRDSSESR
jgi:hypothetical protein